MVNLTTKVHLRYHEPSSEQRFAKVTLQSPSLLVKCSGKTWESQSVAALDAVDLFVPVGDEDQLQLVTVVTTFTVLCGCSVVLKHIVQWAERS